MPTGVLFFCLKRSEGEGIRGGRGLTLIISMESRLQSPFQLQLAFMALTLSPARPHFAGPKIDIEAREKKKEKLNNQGT